MEKFKEDAPQVNVGTHLSLPLGSSRLHMDYGNLLTEDGIKFNAFMARVEKRLVEAALFASGNNKRIAADMLGLNRTTLVEKLRKLGHIVKKEKKQ